MANIVNCLKQHLVRVVVVLQVVKAIPYPEQAQNKQQFTVQPLVKRT
jgi:hypothetical protein